MLFTPDRLHLSPFSLDLARISRQKAYLFGSAKLSENETDKAWRSHYVESKICYSRDLTTKLGALEGQKYDESGGIFCFRGYGGKILIKSASKSAKIGYFSKKFEMKYKTMLKKCALKRAFE